DLDGALAALPRLVRYADLADEQPSRFAVLLGVDQDGRSRWADMQREMLHVGIFGGTDAGKDNLIENWFVLWAARWCPLQTCSPLALSPLLQRHLYHQQRERQAGLLACRWRVGTSRRS